MQQQKKTHLPLTWGYFIFQLIVTEKTTSICFLFTEEEQYFILDRS